MKAKIRKNIERWLAVPEVIRELKSSKEKFLNEAYEQFKKKNLSSSCAFNCLVEIKKLAEGYSKEELDTMIENIETGNVPNWVKLGYSLSRTKNNGDEMTVNNVFYYIDHNQNRGFTIIEAIDAILIFVTMDTLKRLLLLGYGGIHLYKRFNYEQRGFTPLNITQRKSLIDAKTCIAFLDEYRNKFLSEDTYVNKIFKAIVANLDLKNGLGNAIVLCDKLRKYEFYTLLDFVTYELDVSTTPKIGQVSEEDCKILNKLNHALTFNIDELFSFKEFVQGYDSIYNRHWCEINNYLDYHLFGLKDDSKNDAMMIINEHGFYDKLSKLPVEYMITFETVKRCDITHLHEWLTFNSFGYGWLHNVVHCIIRIKLDMLCVNNGFGTILEHFDSFIDLNERYPNGPSHMKRYIYVGSELVQWDKTEGGWKILGKIITCVEDYVTYSKEVAATKLPYFALNYMDNDNKNKFIMGGWISEDDIVKAINDGSVEITPEVYYGKIRDLPNKSVN